MADDLARRMGHHLRRLRMGLDLSQEEVAGRCGLTRANLSRIENAQANVTVITLEAICHVLHLSLAEFFEDLPLR